MSASIIGIVVALTAFVSVDNSSDQQKPFTSLYDASDDMLQIIDFNVGKADAAVVRFKNSIEIPHHGNYDPKLEELMDIVTPEYAIISTSSDETPSNKLLKLLTRFLSCKDMLKIIFVENTVIFIINSYDIRKYVMEQRI